MKKILFIGGGTHLNSCLDVIKSEKNFYAVGFVDKFEKDIPKNKIQWLGSDDKLKVLRKKFSYAFISVGQIKNLAIREKIYNRLIKLNFTLPKIISRQAYISSTSEIGSGTIVMHGAIINSNVKIGNNCIINTGSIIEHDTIIGNHCHIAPGAIINGQVIIGNNTFIGSGSTIKQNTHIGSKCFVNANLFVKKKLKNNSVLK